MRRDRPNSGVAAGEVLLARSLELVTDEPTGAASNWCWMIWPRKTISLGMGSIKSASMTMTMTHSKKSHIHRMKAWPHRQECRDHGPTKKNLFCWYSLLIGKVRRYKLLEDRL